MRRLNPIKAWFISLVGIYGVFSAATPAAFRFLDRVDLVFHEAGHVIFGFFGEFIGILGGSLTTGTTSWDGSISSPGTRRWEM